MPKRVPRIVVVGSCYVDMAIKCDQFPMPGEQVLGSGFSCNCAGGGANQSIAAVMCDCEVAIVGKVGADCFGQMVRDLLQESTVEINLLEVADAKNSGVIMTYVNSDGENSSIVTPGANFAIQPEYIESVAVEQAIAGADICLIDGSLPPKVVSATIKMAEMRRTKSVLTLSLVFNEKTCEVGVLPKEYRNADVLIAEIQASGNLEKNIFDNIQDFKMVGAKLVSQGFNTVVINTSKNGFFVFDHTGVEHVNCFKLDVVNRSCCRDSFSGAFAASIATGDSVAKASLFANAASSITASRFGLQDSLPRKDEILKLLMEQGD